MRHFFARAAMAAILLLTACTSAQSGGSAPAGQAVNPNALKVAVRALVVNPTPQASSLNHQMYWPMYDNLTALGSTYEVMPSVAEKWEMAADGSSWTFAIRGGLRFSNGDPLTADDVAFTIATILEKNWPQRPLLANVSGVRTIDASTVELSMRQTDLTIASAASFIWILPKKYFEQLGFEAYVLKPIGSGPYVLAEFKPFDTMRFTKRPEKHAIRDPRAPELIIRAVPDNARILKGLQSGEFDIAAGIVWSGAEIDQFKKLGLEVRAEPVIQVSAALPQGSWETRDTPLKDKRVRLAMNYAVNRAALADAVLKGYGKPSGQPAIPGTLSYRSDMGAFPYDPRKAKSLLTEAGYPNGFALQNGIDFIPSQISPEVPLAIKSDLKAVGIEAEANANDLTVFSDKAFGRNGALKGDIWVGRGSDTLGLFGQNRGFNGCGKPAGGGVGSVWYCNPEWDKLLDLAAAEPDIAKRGELLRQATKIQADDVTTMYLYDEPAFIVLGAKARSFAPQNPLYYSFDTAARAG